MDLPDWVTAGSRFNVKECKRRYLIAIIVTTLLGIPFGVTSTTDTVSFTEALQALPSTFGVIFTSEGLPSLFCGCLTFTIGADYDLCLQYV